MKKKESDRIVYNKESVPRKYIMNVCPMIQNIEKNKNLKISKDGECDRSKVNNKNFFP